MRTSKQKATKSPKAQASRRIPKRYLQIWWWAEWSCDLATRKLRIVRNVVFIRTESHSCSPNVRELDRERISQWTRHSASQLRLKLIKIFFS